MNALRAAVLCGLLFMCGGYLVGSRAGVLDHFDARVMPWVEPGWRLTRGARVTGNLAAAWRLNSDDVVAAAIGGLVFVLPSALLFPDRPVLALPAVAIGAGLGLWLLQYSRARRQRALDERMCDEVPQVADLLSLHISAGLSISQSLHAVSAMTAGVLSAELVRVCRDIDEGVALGSALRASRNRTTASLWRSLADALIGCAERGSPVAATIRAQAHDARASRHQQVLADAGRREVAMLAPVVFLTLPATVMVALLPGLIAFKAGI